MDTKTGFINAEWVTYMWVMGVSLWGGLVSYFDKKEPFSLLRLFAHLTSASFAGLMTYFICQYGNVPGPITGVMCGIAAHMGTPAMVALVMKLRFVRQFFETTPEKPEKDGAG